MELRETWHSAAALKAQRNKTDKNDARALAQLARIGWFKAVQIKSEESLRLRLLLTHRRSLKRKVLDIENEVRQAVKVFGIRFGSGFGHAAFAKRVRAALAGDDVLLGITECRLRAWAVLWEEYNRLHKLLVKLTLRDELCRRIMAIPGVGPVTALAFETGVDEPRRFRRSKTVGAHFALRRGASSWVTASTSTGTSRASATTMCVPPFTMRRMCC